MEVGVKKGLEILKTFGIDLLKVHPRSLKSEVVIKRDKKCPKIFRKCYQENKMCA